METNIVNQDDKVQFKNETKSYKTKILQFYHKHQHLIKYAVIGVTGVTLDFKIFMFLTQKLNFNYQIANAISVSIGITNNFILNYFINFNVKSQFFKRFLKFYAVGLFGLLLNAGLLFCLVHFLNTSQIIAKLSSLLIVVCAQFFLNKKITFKQ